MRRPKRLPTAPMSRRHGLIDPGVQPPQMQDTTRHGGLQILTALVNPYAFSPKARDARGEVLNFCTRVTPTPWRTTRYSSAAVCERLHNRLAGELRLTVELISWILILHRIQQHVSLFSTQAFPVTESSSPITLPVSLVPCRQKHGNPV
jgi:hypothetical protein